MNSRLERYISKNITKRTQKNKEIYRLLDAFLFDSVDYDVSKYKNKDFDIMRLDKIVRDYEEYKHEQERKVRYSRFDDEVKGINRSSDTITYDKSKQTSLLETNKNDVSQNKSWYSVKELFNIRDELIKNRKFNLRVKRISGLVFIINTCFIIFLIYQSIR